MRVEKNLLRMAMASLVVATGFGCANNRPAQVWEPWNMNMAIANRSFNADYTQAVLTLNDVPIINEMEGSFRLRNGDVLKINMAGYFKVSDGRGIRKNSGRCIFYQGNIQKKHVYRMDLQTYDDINENIIDCIVCLWNGGEQGIYIQNMGCASGNTLLSDEESGIAFTEGDRVIRLSKNK